VINIFKRKIARTYAGEGGGEGDKDIEEEKSKQGRASERPIEGYNTTYVNLWMRWYKTYNATLVLIAKRRRSRRARCE
jgi:hypothetical protein